jgi:hypothetical protein
MLHGESDLDWRHLSATALQALPGAAINALAPHVTRVTLPAGLPLLPRFLIRLTKLRSIELAMCQAEQIDVTPWDLDTLTVTGLTNLRWITANAGTTVSCPAPGIRRKVCVNLYRDGQLVGRTAAGSRRYIKLPARRQFNMNGEYPMRDGELAFCRHIAHWWFGARAGRRAQKRIGDVALERDMYHVLQSAASFQRAIDSDDGIYNLDLAAANDSRHILVGNDLFGRVIEHEFRELSAVGLPATRRFRVTSVTHAMGLELTVRAGNHGKPEYTVVFYDPNVSATHLRIKYHQFREARDLRLSELFPRQDFISDYFGNAPPVVMLVQLDAPGSTRKRSLCLMLSAPETHCRFPFDLAIDHRFEAASMKIIKDLRALPPATVDWKAFFFPQAPAAFPRLSVAVAQGLPRVTRSLLEIFIKLSAEGVLDKSAVFRMLQQSSLIEEPPVTALWVACKWNRSECIAGLTDVLVRPEADGLASPAEYESLLRDGGPNRPSPYAVALMQDECGAAITMVESMLRLTAARRITGAQFVRLFACHDSDGIPAIERDFAEGETELVLGLMKPVIHAADAGLMSWETAEALHPRRANGTPSLRATYRAGHAAFLAAYGALVLSAVALRRIHAVDAIAILVAGMPAESPVEALRAIAPRGEVLKVLIDLLVAPSIARWVTDEVADALDALVAADLADAVSSGLDRGSAPPSMPHALPPPFC